MKKHWMIGLFVFITMTIGTTGPVAWGYTASPNDQIIFTISVGQDNQATTTMKYYIPCLASIDGNTVFPSEGMVLYLHSMILNHINPCTDVRATGIVQSGWVIFTFNNPPIPTPGGLMDRMWISNKHECNPTTEEWWGCISPINVNPFYREDCNGNPGIEAVFYEDSVKPVPPDTPCDMVGEGCV